VIDARVTETGRDPQSDFCFLLLQCKSLKTGTCPLARARSMMPWRGNFKATKAELGA
jgi:hypothetical protein